MPRRCRFSNRRFTDPLQGTFETEDDPGLRNRSGTSPERDALSIGEDIVADRRTAIDRSSTASEAF